MTRDIVVDTTGVIEVLFEDGIRLDTNTFINTYGLISLTVQSIVDYNNIDPYLPNIEIQGIYASHKNTLYQLTKEALQIPKRIFPHEATTTIDIVGTHEDSGETRVFSFTLSTYLSMNILMHQIPNMVVLNTITGCN